MMMILRMKGKIFLLVERNRKFTRIGCTRMPPHALWVANTCIVVLQSGLAVQNPGDSRKKAHLIQDILKRAAEYVLWLYLPTFKI